MQFNMLADVKKCLDCVYFFKSLLHSELYP